MNKSCKYKTLTIQSLCKHLFLQVTVIQAVSFLLKPLIRFCNSSRLACVLTSLSLELLQPLNHVNTNSLCKKSIYRRCFNHNHLRARGYSISANYTGVSLLQIRANSSQESSKAMYSHRPKNCSPNHGVDYVHLETQWT